MIHDDVAYLMANIRIEGMNVKVVQWLRSGKISYIMNDFY